MPKVLMQLARPSKALYRIAPIRRYALMRDMNAKLEKWDVLPLSDKLKNIRKTHSVVLTRLSGGTHNFPRDFWFRVPASMLSRNDLIGLEEHLRERLDAEERNLKDMETVFREWGVKLDPKRVPHPFGTSWVGYDNHMVFTSPTMRKFYDSMKKKGKRPGNAKIPGGLGKFVEANKSFGLASTTTKVDAESAYVIQPFRFFETKREWKKLGARGEWAKEGTGTGLPMEDADVLFFYFALKHAAQRGAKKFYIRRQVSPIERQPYERIYDRLIGIAPEKGMDSAGGGYDQKYGIFTRRQRRG